jgi:FixJ family two-component response regulator
LQALANLSTKRAATKWPVVAVVDDDPSVLSGIKRLLNASGIDTEVFSSGEDFLERDAASKVTCVVLDINLGGISGIETRRRLSARGDAIPVIFITARDTAAVRKEAMDSGCAAYLLKPFSGNDLIVAIRRATSCF